jgi:hypothetical protein
MSRGIIYTLLGIAWCLFFLLIYRKQQKDQLARDAESAKMDILRRERWEQIKIMEKIAYEHGLDVRINPDDTFQFPRELLLLWPEIDISISWGRFPDERLDEFIMTGKLPNFGKNTNFSIYRLKS